MAFVENKKIFHDYTILETYEAGISLKGHEVKAIKTGRVSIRGAYVKIINEEAFLIGATIPPYQPDNTPASYDPERSRKLLLKKKEIMTLIGKGKHKGLTIVPIRLYNKKGKIKLAIGVAQAKRKKDKREILKKREVKRNIEREVKRY